MHTGLAEQSHTYLLQFSAFPTCYFSLCVSTPGRLGVLEVLLSPSPALRRNFICTDTAHKPIQAIILCPFTRMRISLHLHQIELSLLHHRLMNMLTVLAGSIAPLRHRALIQAKCLHNRLDWTAIRHQRHHNDDESFGLAQALKHRSCFGAERCSAHLAAIPRTRLPMAHNSPFVDFPSCHAGQVRAKYRRRIHLFCVVFVTAQVRSGLAKGRETQ